MIVMDDGGNMSVYFDKKEIYPGTEWIPVK